MPSLSDTHVFFLAQGRGSRWNESDRKRAGLPPEDFPPFKQMLMVGGETLLARSVRFFQEAGFANLTVIATEELLRLTGQQDLGITLLDPGSDVLEPVHNLLVTPPADVTVIVLGDVLFSRAAVAKLVEGVQTKPSGCMARVGPSKVTTKRADEVFAIWLDRQAAELARERCAMMVPRLPNMTGHPNMTRPSKPWAFPFLACEDMLAMQVAYEQRANGGLMAAAAMLTTVDDYTDDVDSPIEYAAFWKPMLKAALEDV